MADNQMRIHPSKRQWWGQYTLYIIKDATQICSRNESPEHARS